MLKKGYSEKVQAQNIAMLEKEGHTHEEAVKIVAEHTQQERNRSRDKDDRRASAKRRS